jgi:cytochrome c oxidase cbb3-type subunit 3
MLTFTVSRLLGAVVLPTCAALPAAAETDTTAIDTPIPSPQIGATVFQSRCTLCHGNDGMGEGLMPLKLKQYPNTNLLKPNHPQDRANVHDIVVYGGTRGNVSNLMPPMGNDLTWTEVESVVDFVLQLRQQPEAARALLDSVRGEVEVSRKAGQDIFASRCVLCHGKFGEGNGRMAKVIKNPPPADLTASRLPDDYLKQIISKGGAGVSRSPQMPPWGDLLTPVEIDSLILYLKSLRD